jgi:hypothetical protein
LGCNRRKWEGVELLFVLGIVVAHFDGVAELLVGHTEVVYIAFVEVLFAVVAFADVVAARSVVGLVAVYFAVVVVVDG